MKHHPLQEIKDLAVRIENSLKEKYSSSFSHKTYEEQEKYLSESIKLATILGDKKNQKQK